MNPQDARRKTTAQLERGTVAGYDRMDERVTNLDRRLGELVDTVNNGFHSIQSAVAQLVADFTKGRGTNWSAIFSGLGAVFTLTTVLGYLTIAPMRDDLKRIEAEIQTKLAKDTFDIYHKEYLQTTERLAKIAEKLADDSATKREIELRAQFMLRDQQMNDARITRLFDWLQRISVSQQPVPVTPVVPPGGIK